MAIRSICILSFLSVVGRVWAMEPPALEVSDVYSLDWPERMDVSGLS